MRQITLNTSLAQRGWAGARRWLHFGRAETLGLWTRNIAAYLTLTMRLAATRCATSRTL